MEIRVLRYFLTVAQEESITKAAEMLHITQPTLSRQLAQLEEETGVTLFVRGSRKITLTDEGLLLRRRAEEIVSLAEKTMQELMRQDNELEGVITIGSGEFESVKALGEICSSFKKKYPKVQFEIYTATADVVKERIERGVIDVGLLLEPIDMEKFAFIRLNIKEKWAVLMRADDPLVYREGFTAEELSKHPLILPSRLSVQSELASWFGDCFSRLEVVCTGNLTTNSAIMVQNRLGYAIIIEGSAPFRDTSQMITKPLIPPLSSTNVLCWNRGKPFGKATKKFIEYMKAYVEMDSSE